MTAGDPNASPPSERLFGAAAAEPTREVPDYLLGHLTPRLIDVLEQLDPVHLDIFALSNRLNWRFASARERYRNPVGQLVQLVAAHSAGLYLDLTQYALREWLETFPDEQDFGREIDAVLAVGGSAFAVSPDGRSIVMRNDETAEAAAKEALTDETESSQQLAIAWAEAFGRDPDPQAAWAAAIRAVEAAVIPIVWPNSNKRGKQTLTTARNRLRDEPTRWSVRHPTITLDTLVAMLSGLAYEPRRHGADAREPATLIEAAAAVHLAVTVVSWLRGGILLSVAP